MGERGNTSTAKRIVRYEKVFATFVKYGFEDLLSHPPFNKIVPQTNVFVPSRKGRKVSQFTRHERIRLICEELGTTFIKFAQIASNRPDLLPEELISELEKLQDSAPAVPSDQILKTLEEELSRPLNELLEDFDEKPLASASIAQVHKALLRGGKEVVLKIQRPDIREVIKTDISILKNLVSIIESYFPQYMAYNPGELVKMFEDSITEELDFKLEAMNLRYFQKMFVGNDNVYVPEYYDELCTDKVICIEYVHGYKITDMDNLKRFKVSGRDLALRGIGLYFEQVFDHGFFHADPHPGNIFVMEDGRIAFVDFGMMGTVTEADKILFAKLLLSIYEKDIDTLKKSILSFSNGLNKEQKRALEYDLLYFLRNYSTIAIEDIDGNEVMEGLNTLFFDYKLRIPSNLLLLLKALIIIEGVGLKLDPQYDIIQNIGPYVQRLIAKRNNPKRFQGEIMRSVDDVSSLLRQLPEDTREIIQKVKDGKLHIEFEHKGLDPFYRNIDIITNRLSFTLLIVALIIGSSIIINAE
ncbi:MAG: AarF/ABC1/UbiB kinase family protein, partial [Saprospiraceae bacterium]|nr:AarF/ABC1/UbiB kinase family protein [Saprospiraceae bacterium]